MMQTWTWHMWYTVSLGLYYIIAARLLYIQGLKTYTYIEIYIY